MAAAALMPLLLYEQIQSSGQRHTYDKLDKCILLLLQIIAYVPFIDSNTPFFPLGVVLGKFDQVFN